MITQDFAQEKPLKLGIFGLASCFGCQLQIANMESEIMALFGQVDLRYWQLTHSLDLIDDIDIAIIEGAVTTQEAAYQVKEIRELADVVIAIGACATLAGIPGLAIEGFEDKLHQSYQSLPSACDLPIAPKPISAVIPVDYEVYCCPIDPQDFLQTLNAALHKSNVSIKRSTLCSECKRNEKSCMYEDGIMCLGMVTRAGCSARCVNLGRACKGCRGLSPDANLQAAYCAIDRYGMDRSAFDRALELFNAAKLRNSDND